MGEAVRASSRWFTPFAGPSAVGWGLVGSAAYGLFQWLTLVVLARAGTPALVGQFTLGLAVTAPVIMFFNMQLGWLQATDQAGAYPFEDYRDQRLLALVGAGIVVALFATTRQGTPELVIILLVGGNKMVESLSDLCMGNFQRHSRLDLVARSQVVRGALSLGAFTVALLLRADLAVALLAMGTGMLLALGGHDWRFNRRLPRSAAGPAAPKGERLRRLTLDALPLGISALLVSLNASVPRLVIERELGPYPLGVFAAMAYLIIGGRMIAAPFGQMMAPRLGAAVAARDLERFRGLVGRLMLAALGLGVTGVLVAVLAGGPMLTLLYGLEYAEEAQTFAVLMGVAAISYVALFCQIGSTAARLLRGQVAVVLLSVVVTAILALVAVPRFGIRGAAIAMAGGALAELAGWVALLHGAMRRLAEAGGRAGVSR